MVLTLGITPCPNDTFIFDALIHHKVPTEGLDFEVLLEDIETLNGRALGGQLDMVKVSYHAFAYVRDKYVLLDAGSALGCGVGPLLITKLDQPDANFCHKKIGIPGQHTTANLLFCMAYPAAKHKVDLPFSEIEAALLEGSIDFGLIIHESRFTYQHRGLKKVVDLGAYWERTTGCMIPLGGIAIKRSLPDEVKHKVNKVLSASVSFALANPESGMDFICAHAQVMHQQVVEQHINLYVNKYSVHLGKEGRQAVQLLFDVALKKNLIPNQHQPLFLAAHR